MPTISQIQQAHAKVKTGADFPQYVNDLAQLGVKGYSTFVHDGHAEYLDTDPLLRTEAKYAALNIAAQSNGDKFIQYLKEHQQGGSDYLTFCRQAAETGVEKWTVDVLKRTCTYYDVQGHVLLEEQIP